ncbi:hypothetical protein OOK44_35450 [Streptomyces cellulosae]|uniref:Uncharacterized protein n=1 Tax=Streptomyces althioticus TaxID=83380 RepID=A0ABZ1YGR6_9ACTN|nr:hypothetical protein [Streptomyces cellulosae]WTB86472.1 hypothetical protein OG837_34920 [Streptomyces cellulosae]WTB93298.1 hypothetical protein OIE99_34200 [Streptomyces cellulosae]WTC60690.1 hypothetical protein OH715_35955 [Streptomyces cellulosae]
MFDLLRRRRLRAAAPPAPQPATAPPPAMADAGLPARVDLVRRTLVAAGVDFEELGAAPEPAWFAQLRTGQCLPLGPAELKETADHLPGVAVEALLSEEACTRGCSGRSRCSGHCES